MAYQSPLGYNFKLEASISAAKELQAKETSKNDEFVLDNSGHNKSSPYGRSNSENKYSNSPGWQRQNWKSPRPSSHNESAPISQYYHPSMVEDPWKELEEAETS